jgi:hypothetical protein
VTLSRHCVVHRIHRASNNSRAATEIEKRSAESVVSSLSGTNVKCNHVKVPAQPLATETGTLSFPPGVEASKVTRQLIDAVAIKQGVT